MNSFLTTIIIGVSLSMDAFSLALVYGMQKMDRGNKILLSVIVGLYHFVMPLVGALFGSIIMRKLDINVNVMIGIIFLIIGIEMVISGLKQEEVKVIFSIVGFIIFGFSVSLDSFTTGIGLNVINNNYLEVSLIFFSVSSFFTYLGLVLGSKIGLIFGRISNLFGGIILTFFGIIYILK